MNAIKKRFYFENNIDTIFFHSIRSKIYNEIDRKTEDYILNVNVDELVNYLVNKYTIDFPTLDLNNKTVESYIDYVPGNLFPVEFDVSNDKTVQKRIIRYTIPYAGNLEILKYKPSKLWSIAHVEVEEFFDGVVIDIIDFYGDPEKIKVRFESKLNDIMSVYSHLKEECDDFNTNLSSYIKSTIENRRQSINNNTNFLKSLGVPLTKNQDAPVTFSVPTPQLRKKIILEPTVKNVKIAEPSITPEIYFDILKTVNDIGKNFERMPSIYKDKEEEDLRDQILFTIDPNFEMGSATGETFHKKGKTDILLIYNGTVVFVAECKFWAGEKSFHKAIDQLLGYLTWRNSKTALIVFVKNKDISNVLNKIKNETKKHPNFIREETHSGEAWFNYTFHLKGDKEREISMAVMVYHIPEE